SGEIGRHISGCTLTLHARVQAAATSSVVKNSRGCRKYRAVRVAGATVLLAGGPDTAILPPENRRKPLALRLLRQEAWPAKRDFGTSMPPKWKPRWVLWTISRS